ncbi:glutathione S-transferase C-terminal domain-containing protein, partial [Klebsiella pneumoniae]|uniref:glutathione S-transferase C-terminal domain-containing protein n=1 Tax=Klebsiella pneumoniae TaxID=573 RepID=UPI002758B7CD|nr:hypothetical protein [Klebsiella pneumoniae]
WLRALSTSRVNAHTSQPAELEADAIAELASHFDIAAISVACALGYLDFRHPDMQWRLDNPRLAAWYAEVSQRPSMQQTQ